jgi:hypothetical protein
MRSVLLSGDDRKDSATSLKYKARYQLGKSHVSTSDLRYFLPAAGGFNEAIELSEEYQDRVGPERRKITVSFRDYSLLECDLTCRAADIKDTFIHISIETYGQIPLILK